MQTSTQFNQWIEEEIENLNYSGRQSEQFKTDLLEAINQGVFDEFIESIEAYPYPLAFNH